MASSVPSVFMSLAAVGGLGLALLPGVGARSFGFLRATGAAQEEAPDALLKELELALGEGHRIGAESRMQALEDLMLPTFRSLPKMPGDRLEMGVAKYMLHRLFVSKHNWNVHAFAPGGEVWSSSSPTAVFREHSAGGGVAAEVFERRFANGQGLTLREAAMFAATLESLVHEELTERFQTAMRVTGLRTQASLKDRDVDLLMDAYMVLYLSRMNASATSVEVLESLSKFKTNPYWAPTRKWLREVRREVVVALPADAEKNSAASVVRQLEEASYRYGRYADQECIDLKTDLMQHEGRTPGHVPLSRFYGAALRNGSWQFSESQAFLKQAGALDDSESQTPNVIIPNWIGLPSNCVAGSKFYSVCCINECEALLGQLERHVAAPAAAPGRLVELVEQLTSATVEAPRALSAELIERLEGIAARHSGSVPLHGRLFMQWMHNSFPRECPFPHLAGATRPLGMREFEQETGHRADLERNELAARLQDLEASTVNSGGVSDHVELVGSSRVWSDEEELLMSAQLAPLVDTVQPSALRAAALLFMVVSMLGAMLQTASSARTAALSGTGSSKAAKA